MLSIADYVEHERDRASAMRLSAVGLELDLSRSALSGADFQSLLATPRVAGLPERIDALMRGDPINLSEARPALHTALRAQADDARSEVEAAAIAVVLSERERFLALAEALRDGRVRAADGTVIDQILHLGIGGSDLGPRLVADALYHDGPKLGFISNVDAHEAQRVLPGFDARRTLVVYCSKSYTTEETRLNLELIRRWFARTHPRGEAALAAQLVAVTSRADLAARDGISAERCLTLPDWVGGRYSLWSAVGLSTAAALGKDAFLALLQGARAMDLHARHSVAAQNLPVALGAVGAHYRTSCGWPTRVLVPYDARLRLLVSHLQQVDMESNGKRARADGRPGAPAHAAPALLGGVGSNAQHAFFQALHQGPDVMPVEFIGIVAADHEHAEQHRVLNAHLLAQASALSFGRSRTTLMTEAAHRGLDGDEAASYVEARLCPGNRPSTLIWLPRLDPFAFGALLALYEHRTFVEGQLYGVNSFDQWGVELGKTIARDVAAALGGDAAAEPRLDPLTRASVEWLRSQPVSS